MGSTWVAGTSPSPGEAVSASALDGFRETHHNMVVVVDGLAEKRYVDEGCERG